jgi:hypothetical protein
VRGLFLITSLFLIFGPRQACDVCHNKKLLIKLRDPWAKFAVALGSRADTAICRAWQSFAHFYQINSSALAISAQLEPMCLPNDRDQYGPPGRTP